MKKRFLLIGLLILPLVIYLYFSLAKHNSLFLPIISKNINELPEGKTLDGKFVQLEDKISIVGYLGNDLEKRKESIFNLSQKINNKYRGFADFQIVMLVPEGNEEKVNKMISELAVMADISDWRFVFTSPENIARFHKSLDVEEQLDAQYGSYYVFIVDKDRNVRGRNGKGKDGSEEYKEGYNTFSAAELHNEMTDDVKILLREYRLALKRNKNRREI
ncbi:hypothetical protein [Flavobacterium sp. MK4S-17]|uniref:hypothetical protein n=1 Tax=Flavobacterium sp. MK4S-17 TaxID=2543737 RepID=UPI00135A1C09|nr:hypothetical protein [Flavobacterium sp. MK4S-17]